MQFASRAFTSLRSGFQRPLNASGEYVVVISSVLSYRSVPYTLAIQGCNMVCPATLPVGHSKSHTVPRLQYQPVLLASMSLHMGSGSY